LTLALVALFPVGLAIGYAVGYGRANAANAQDLGALGAVVEELRREALELEGEIVALLSPIPDESDAVRVLHRRSHPTDAT